MAGKIRKALEWLGHIETIHAIAQAEFVRTLLLPTVATVLTLANGGYRVGRDRRNFWRCPAYVGHHGIGSRLWGRYNRNVAWQRIHRT